MAACLSGDILRQKDNFANFSQASDNLKVFHQGLVGKAAYAFESGGANEICLITGKDFAKARTQVGGEGNKAIRPLIAIETDSKCSTNHVWRGECVLDVAEGIVGEQRICMQEKKDFPCCYSGSSIHLGGTTSSGSDDLAVAPGDFNCAIGASPINDKQFAIAVGTLMGEMDQLIFQQGLFIQHGHDDREAHEGLLRQQSS